LQATVPVTAPAEDVTVKVPVVPAVTVEQFKAAPALSGSSAGSCRKVALIVGLKVRPLAPVVGVVETTEGPATASKFQE
jgi:hypothetical protein